MAYQFTELELDSRTYIEGDIDIDCAVGLADLEIVLNSWGPCLDCVNCLADLDGDCAVAVPDLLALLANWG